MRVTTWNQIRRTSLLGLIALLGTLIVGSEAQANHGTRTLDVTPETVRVEVGSTQLLTATLSAPADVSSGAINIDFENESGANDNDGTTLSTPDFTCSIAAGERSCSISYEGTVAGEDTFRVWIDHDGVASTVEADVKEARDEARQAGNDGSGPCSTPKQEPDCTDVVRVNWVSGGGAALDCDDSRGSDRENEIRPAGGGSTSNEVYTCFVTDELGNPTNDADPVAAGVQPIVVNVEIENGVNDADGTDGASYDSPDYTCTAGEPDGAATGSCQITITQNEAEIGTAAVCFWVGDAARGQSLCADEAITENQAAEGSDKGNDLADRVSLTWAARAASGLDAEPETAESGLEAPHAIEVTIYDQFGEPFVGESTVEAEFFKGSPSDADENTPETPDAICSTVNDSTCTITFDQIETPGTDLICVWTGDEPAMAGTNNNGTCGVEGLLDEDDTVGSVDAAQPRNDNVDVVQKIWQQPTDAVTLDCAPEKQTQSKGSSARISCRAKNSQGILVTGAEIDAEITGANDVDDADLPESPDLSCVTDAEGSCVLVHGKNGVGRTSENGTSVYRAWIDEDNDNSTSEADTTESVSESGATAEPDNTDVVERSFTTPSGGCTLVGTTGDDRLVGTSSRDVICGLDGDDTIEGLAGKDLLLGGNGGDEIKGGSSKDVLGGGRGNDSLKGGKGDDSLFGGRGTDKCKGGAGRDSTKGCEIRR